MHFERMELTYTLYTDVLKYAQSKIDNINDPPRLQGFNDSSKVCTPKTNSRCTNPRFDKSAMVVSVGYRYSVTFGYAYLRPCSRL